MPPPVSPTGKLPNQFLTGPGFGFYRGGHQFWAGHRCLFPGGFRESFFNRTGNRFLSCRGSVLAAPVPCFCGWDCVFGVGGGVVAPGCGMYGVFLGASGKGDRGGRLARGWQVTGGTLGAHPPYPLLFQSGRTNAVIALYPPAARVQSMPPSSLHAPSPNNKDHSP